MKAVIKICFFCLLIIVSVFQVSCKKKPDKQPIIIKDENKMIEIAMKESQTDPRDFPQTFTCDFFSRDGKAHIFSRECSIRKLGNRYPIYRCVAIDFDQEVIDTVSNCLIKNCKMYEVNDNSKDYYLYILNDLYSKQDQYLQNGMESIFNREVKKYTELYENAPISAPLLSDMRLKTYSYNEETKQYNYTGINVGEESVPLQKVKYFYVRNNLFETAIRGAVLQFSDNKYGHFSDYYPDRTLEVKDIDNKSLYSIGITIDEAERIAHDFLKETKLPFEVYDIVLQSEKVYDAQSKDSIRYYYYIRCSRKIDNEQCVLISVPMESQYNASWAYEQLYISVDQDGIFSIEWASPYAIQEIVVKESNLLPFSDIYTAFEQALSLRTVQVQTESTNKIKGIDICITNVCLGLQRILEKGSIKTGLLIPVWCFFGEETITYDDASVEVYNGFNYRLEPILMINAIDGTVINPIEGY